MEREQNFTKGPIFWPLVRFALPVLLALLLQTMYGAVDLLIVGQFGGELAEVYVSAVATGSQLMHTVTMVISGLAMGVTILVARQVGAGEPEEAGRTIAGGIRLFAVVSLAVTAAVICAARPLARVMQAPPEALEETVRYVVICASGTILIVGYNLLGSIFRGLGDSRLPLVTVAVACALNVLGDLLLVAVFRMGAAGAAAATIAAQGMSVLISLRILRRRKLPFRLGRAELRSGGGRVREILRLGIPISLQDLLVNVSFLVITAIVNSLGLTPSAGVGVAEKLCGFLMLVPSAFLQSMSAFAAQNLGAGKPERARRALLCGILSSLAVSVVTFFFTFFHGDLLSGIFAKDAPVIAASAEYLKAYAVDCLLTAFLFCFIGYFNGLGCTKFVMIQGLVGAFGVRLPVSYLMSLRTPASLFAIGLATPASSAVQILLCGIWLWVVTRREKQGRLPGGALPGA